MTDYVLVSYRLADGRTVAFNHPDAVADRLKAIRGWKHSEEFLRSVAAKYGEIFTADKSEDEQ